MYPTLTKSSKYEHKIYSDFGALENGQNIISIKKSLHYGKEVFVKTEKASSNQSQLFGIWHSKMVKFTFGPKNYLHIPQEIRGVPQPHFKLTQFYLRFSLYSDYYMFTL